MGLFSTSATLFCTGHILLRDRLLKHNILRKTEVRGRRGRRRKEVKERRGYWIERGSTRSHAAEKWLWKWLWTCSMADCGMMTKGNAVFLSCTEKNVLLFLTPRTFFTQRLLPRLARCSTGNALPWHLVHISNLNRSATNVILPFDSLLVFRGRLTFHVVSVSLLSHNNTICWHSCLLFHSFHNKAVHSSDKHLCLSTLHQFYNI